MTGIKSTATYNPTGIETSGIYILLSNKSSSSIYRESNSQQIKFKQNMYIIESYDKFTIQQKCSSVNVSLYLFFYRKRIFV